TAAPLIRPNSIASTQGGLIMEDILFSAFSNQASNAGGVLVQAFNLSKLTRVQVDYTAAFGFKQIGGSTLGDTAFNTYFQCMVSNPLAGCVCYHVQTNAASLSTAEGFRLIDCRTNSVSGGGRVAMKWDKNGTAAVADGAVIACNFEGPDQFIVSDAAFIQYIWNRFEVTSGTASIVLNHPPYNFP